MKEKKIQEKYYIWKRQKKNKYIDQIYIIHLKWTTRQTNMSNKTKWRSK